MSANMVELVLMLGGGAVALYSSVKKSLNLLILGSALCLISMAFLSVSN